MPKKRASKTAKKALHKRFKSFSKLCLKSVHKTFSKLKRGWIVPKLNLSNLGFVAGFMVLILIGLSLYSVRVGRTQPPSLGFLPNNLTASLVLDVNKRRRWFWRRLQNRMITLYFSNVVLLQKYYLWWRHLCMTVEDLIYSNFLLVLDFLNRRYIG